MKRIVSAVLATMLLASVASASAANPGSQTNPLITKTYLEDTYQKNVIKESSDSYGEKLQKAVDAASLALNGAIENALLRTGSYDGYEFDTASKDHTVLPGYNVHMVTGGIFTLKSGSAVLNVTNGEVINISSGRSVSSGAAITANDRYFLTENTAATFEVSATAKVRIDGYYRMAAAPSTEVELPFTDVAEGAWYHKAVEFVYARQYFNGTSETKFSPGSTMTRGMFVTVLWRVADKPAVSGSCKFTDVPSDIYYRDPVVWGNDKGIVTGVSDTRFNPNGDVTREQMAVFMYRYAKTAGFDTKVSGSDVLKNFPDTGDISEYAVDAITWAVDKGIISGTVINGVTKLNPRGNATRAQVAQIVMNFCEKFDV